jgi:hypothetical protein
MKCPICKRSVCVCRNDPELPTRSTLSPSISEHRKKLYFRSQRCDEIYYPNPYTNPSRESVSQKYDGFGPIQKQFDNMPAMNQSRKNHRNEQHFQPRSQPYPQAVPFPQAQSSYSKSAYQPKPFLPYHEYIKVMKNRLPDCQQCTRPTSSKGGNNFLDYRDYQHQQVSLKWKLQCEKHNRW